MSLKIQDYNLTGKINDKKVEHDQCVKKDSGCFISGCPNSIIIHYTAGSTMSSAINTLKNPDIKASAHLIIDRDGSATQLIDFNKIAWHAGRSRWRGYTGMNSYSLGIELVNSGELTRSGNHYISWFSKRYEENDVIEAVHRNEDTPSFWHLYTQKQIEASFDICRLLYLTYPTIKYILGHEEIAPRRKKDPGPAYPLDRLRDQVFIGRRDEINNDDQPEDEHKEDAFTNSAKVTANLLNIRRRPSINSQVISEPLRFGQPVEILDKKGHWCKVRYYEEGWVHKDYIR